MLYRHPAHKGEVEAFLHEAQDILVDVAGLSVGLQELGLTEISYLDHVKVGGGTVIFSHGEFKVPAPATRYLLDKYSIPWQGAQEGEEMATPTGASILAGCSSRKIDTLDGLNIVRRALAGGSRDLPPVPFYLVEKAESGLKKR